jgi:hypothetical protein
VLHCSNVGTQGRYFKCAKLGQCAMEAPGARTRRPWIGSPGPDHSRPQKGSLHRGRRPGRGLAASLLPYRARRHDAAGASLLIIILHLLRPDMAQENCAANFRVNYADIARIIRRLMPVFHAFCRRVLRGKSAKTDREILCGQDIPCARVPPPALRLRSCPISQ